MELYEALYGRDEGDHQRVDYELQVVVCQVLCHVSAYQLEQVEVLWQDASSNQLVVEEVEEDRFYDLHIVRSDHCVQLYHCGERFLRYDTSGMLFGSGGMRRVLHVSYSMYNIYCIL